MATPKKKTPRIQSNKRRTASNKKPSEGLRKKGKVGKIHAKPKKSGKTLGDPLPPPPPPVGVSTCCSVCDGAATGLFGIPWRDQAGTWHCLTWDENISPKYIKADATGVYLSNS
jgi:ribosomal protein L32